MRCCALFLFVAGTSACGDPAVVIGTGSGSSGLASTGANPGSTSSTSSSSAEGSSGSSTSGDSSGFVGSSSTGEVLDGPGCEAPPPCDRGVFEGPLRIESSTQISDIAGYSEILGGLEVIGSDLECLDFLGCLEDVGRDVRIFGNEDLRSTDGLSELRQLGVLTAGGAGSDDEGTLIISENASLETLGGFTQLKRAPESLVVTNNESLRSITAFASLEVVMTDLVVGFNPELESLLGLHGLLALGEECQITNNGALCVSEAFEVCGDLEQGPDGGNTQNNRDDC